MRTSIVSLVSLVVAALVLLHAPDASAAGLAWARVRTTSLAPMGGAILGRNSAPSSAFGDSSSIERTATT